MHTRGGFGMVDTRLRILIVGGGIAGLAVSRALRLAGFRPDVVECRTAPRGSQVGIYLPGNAARALRELGLHEPMQPLGAVIERQSFLDSRGRRLFGAELAELWTGIGECRALPWDDLYRVLLTGAGGAVRFQVCVRDLALPGLDGPRSDPPDLDPSGFDDPSDRDLSDHDPSGSGPGSEPSGRLLPRPRQGQPARAGGDPPAGSRSPDSPAASRSPDSPAGSRSPDSPAGSRSPGSPVGSRSPGSPVGSRSPESPAGARPGRGGGGAPGPAVVTFTDGTVREYDLVIGADGRRSRIRRLAGLGGAPTPLGQVVYRWTVAGGPEIDEWTMLLGRRAAVVVMPMGHRRLYCCAEQVDSLAGGLPVDPAGRAREIFADFGPPVPELLEAAESVQAVPLEEVNLRSWSRGPVLLVGDAAHATSPNLAQGAAMALEDALVLAEVLTGVLREGGPVTVALDRYEQRRRPRTHWVWTQTRRRDRARDLPPALRDPMVRLLGGRLLHGDQSTLLAPR